MTRNELEWCKGVDIGDKGWDVNIYVCVYVWYFQIFKSAKTE